MNQPKARKKKSTYLWLLAVVVLIAVFAVVIFSTEQDSDGSRVTSMIGDVAPGSNKATLRFVNGKTVDLGGEKDAEIMSKLPGRKQNVELITPNGGQYQVMLSDGTKVWLNAGSTLKYPSVFSGKVRAVQLTGEAYFEVVPVKTAHGEKTFIIKTPTQKIEVTGAHLNVNDYDDEGLAKTTLIEGSAKQQSFGQSIILKPAEQSVILKSAKLVNIIQVNPMSAIDWKNGEFIFNTDVKSVMQEISRWYNVEIIYLGNLTNVKLVGTIARSKYLAEVLKTIEETNNVRFRLENPIRPEGGMRVLISPKD